MTNTVRNPYLKPSTAARPAAPPSPPQRRNRISLLSPDDVGLGAVLAAVACIDLDADDGRLVDDEGIGGMSLSAEPSIVYTDQMIDEANTACSLLLIPMERAGPSDEPAIGMPTSWESITA